MRKRIYLTTFVLVLLSMPMSNGQVSHTWVSDQGDGNYRNPVLHADYSDPDAITCW